MDVVVIHFGIGFGSDKRLMGKIVNCSLSSRHGVKK